MTIKHLLDRKWEQGGLGWYDAKDIFGKYKAVVRVEYMDTMSSAGDWGGLIVLNTGKYHEIVPFWQENRYPYGGYRQQTGKVVCKCTEYPDMDLLAEIWEDLGDGRL